jgi:hypothetical protein
MNVKRAKSIDQRRAFLYNFANFEMLLTMVLSSRGWMGGFKVWVDR